MNKLRDKINLRECKHPYSIPLYLDEDNNWWISVHLPPIPECSSSVSEQHDSMLTERGKETRDKLFREIPPGEDRNRLVYGLWTTDPQPGVRVFLQVTLFNGDQIELKGVPLRKYDGDKVEIIFDPNFFRFESEVSGEGI